MSAYMPGEQPEVADFIKLNTNENPYGPAPRVFEAIRREATESLRLYPDPMAAPLRRKAAEVYGLSPEEILVGNGSDELLSMAVRAFVGEGEALAYPVPTYSLYETLGRIQNATLRPYPYGEDFSLPEELFGQDAPLTFLCNPNSPSGTLVDIDEVERLAQSLKGVLVVDEAYVDFSSDNALPLVKTCDNVIVLRSFSKSFSLAGMRLGLALADGELIRGLAKVKDSYNVSRLAVAAGVAALESLQEMKLNVSAVVGTREVFVSKLREMSLEVLPSEANFVMVRLGEGKAKRMYEALKERKILVRFFENEAVSDSLRITIGTDAQMELLLRNMKEILKKEGL